MIIYILQTVLIAHVNWIFKNKINVTINNNIETFIV